MQTYGGMVQLYLRILVCIVAIVLKLIHCNFTGSYTYHVHSNMHTTLITAHPDPSPYPFCNSSSSSNTISPAVTSCSTMSRHTPMPSSDGTPYIPVMT